MIYEPTVTDARSRNEAAPGQGIDGIAYPIELGDERWDAFLDLRYAQRERNQEAIIDTFQGYYDLVREFIAERRYVRLAGNHDTYLNQDRERELRDRIQSELGREVGVDHTAAQIYDVLQVMRGDDVAYVVTHGHQFDPVCHQHGAIPHAKSLGEVFSECLAWAYQGPDRVWRLDDTKKWYIGDSYQNILAREEHGHLPGRRQRRVRPGARQHRPHQGGQQGLRRVAARRRDRVGVLRERRTASTRSPSRSGPATSSTR